MGAVVSGLEPSGDVLEGDGREDPEGCVGGFPIEPPPEGPDDPFPPPPIDVL